MNADPRFGDTDVADAEDTVVLTVDGHVATLTLNRPRKLNALMPQMFERIDAHLTTLRGQESVRCLVLRGAGRSFCAGHDLAHVDGEVSQNLFEAQTIDALEAFPVPTIAQIAGHCITGGLELALACDILVCTDTTAFADTHSKWGLVPVWGMSVRLPERIGRSRAKEMSYTSRMINGVEAQRIGLVDHCVPGEALEEHVSALAAQIGQNSAESNRMFKALYARSAGPDRQHSLDFERSRPYGRPADGAERLRSRT